MKKRKEFKDSTTRIKKENEKLRQELSYKDSQKELFKNIVEKAEKYLSEKLAEQENNKIEENLENTENIEEIDDEDLQQYADIKTTSTMRERVKGIETKDRIKLLMKRSMSMNEMKKVKQSLDDRIDEE